MAARWFFGNLKASARLNEKMEKLEQRTCSALGYLTSRGVLKRNLLTALIVGCLLSLSNQMDLLLREPWSPRIGVKILLNVGS